ncbi:hypothetical protein JST99_05170 [Candidatus Dependentiae bacterium]|nr:hypothetical protein [Candidatus Dependentiae bacterium]
MGLKKMVVLLIGASCAVGTCAMEHDIKKDTLREEVEITGVVFKYPYGIIESGGVKTPGYNDLPKGYSIKTFKAVSDKSYWVPVWATSPISNNWSCHGHKDLPTNFPVNLPLEALLRKDGSYKDDDDTVELSFTNPDTEKIINIVLTINQAKHRLGGKDEHGNDRTFARVLQEHMDYEKEQSKFLAEKK